MRIHGNCFLHPTEAIGIRLKVLLFLMSQRYAVVLCSKQPQQKSGKRKCQWVKQGETNPVLEVVHLGDGGCRKEAGLGNEASRRRKRLSVSRQPLKAQGGTSQTAPQRGCSGSRGRPQSAVLKDTAGSARPLYLLPPPGRAAPAPLRPQGRRGPHPERAK